MSLMSLRDIVPKIYVGIHQLKKQKHLSYIFYLYSIGSCSLCQCFVIVLEQFMFLC